MFNCLSKHNLNYFISHNSYEYNFVDYNWYKTVHIAKPLYSHVNDSRLTTISATDDVDSLKSIEKLIRMHVFGISEFTALRL